MVVLRRLVWLGVFVACGSASAGPWDSNILQILRPPMADDYEPGQRCGAYHGLLEYVDLVDEENRQTKAQYLVNPAHLGMDDQKFENLLGALARIECPWTKKLKGSASVACDQKTIVTSEHLFINEYSGEKYGNPSQCTLFLNLNGKPVPYPLTDNFASGVDVNLPQSDRARLMDSTLQRDWMVIRLANDLPKSVTPFEVWSTNPLSIKGSKSDIVVMSAQQENWGGEITPSYSERQFINVTKPVIANEKAVLGILSNADTTHGSSGGPTVQVIGGKAVLVAVTEGGPNLSGPRAPYHWDSQFSKHLVIENGLLTAISNYCTTNIKPPRTVSFQDSGRVLVSKF